jgi:putative ABC transport system permease protein
MTALNRKLLRDLGHLKTQAVAIALVIGCGVATLTMSMSTLRTMQSAMAAYYERYRFADVFAHLKRAPNSLEARLAEIPGVKRVQTRVAVDVNLDIPGMDEPAVGHIISVDPSHRTTLNDVHLRRGRLIEPGRSREALVSEPFAEAHGLVPGDHVAAIINGKRNDLRIVGIVLSPEYIYQLRSGAVVPDDLRFGVFWMDYDDLAPAYDMDGAFNDVSVSLNPGASPQAVIASIDRLLEPYGGVGAYPRDDQQSHKYVSNEINQLRIMAIVPPSIFFTVSAFLLNVVLSRIISTQREQIAALKAFGYLGWEIGWHYLKFVLVICIAGVALGTAAGSWLGNDLAIMYARFFRFPSFHFVLHPGAVPMAFGVSVAAAMIGAIGSVRRAVKLPPAEAMRPEPPARYRPTVVERLGLQQLFSPAARMILRQLERRPGRALLSILGIAMATAILVMGSFMQDAVDFLLEREFFTTQRQDMTVTFVEPRSMAALHEIRALPGVLTAEPMRTVPVKLRLGHRERRLGIVGLEPEAHLQRPLDRSGAPAPRPEHGLVMSAKLAEVLGARLGDLITVQVLQGRRPTFEAPLEALVDDYVGTSAYMNREMLSRMMRETDTLSGAVLTADASQHDTLYRELKEMPLVASVTIKLAALRSFEKTIAENILRMRMFNLVFATIIAFGVVYNGARVSLSERSRELASLRVLGFTRAEISLILLGELATLTVLAIPVGLALGYALASLACWALESETQRFPLVVERSTFGFATTVIFIATMSTSLVVRRLLDRLDLVAVLKTKE